MAHVFSCKCLISTTMAITMAILALSGFSSSAKAQDLTDHEYQQLEKNGYGAAVNQLRQMNPVDRRKLVDAARAHQRKINSLPLEDQEALKKQAREKLGAEGTKKMSPQEFKEKIVSERLNYEQQQKDDASGAANAVGTKLPAGYKDSAAAWGKANVHVEPSSAHPATAAPVAQSGAANPQPQSGVTQNNGVQMLY